ncbi:MAG: signal transduction histidine kinase (STHK), LytS [Chroococcales cyanobacterium]
MALAQRHYKRAVGLFRNRDQVRDALEELKNAGFPLSKVSIIGREFARKRTRRRKHRRNNFAPEGTVTGVLAGGILGGLTGSLIGVGALAIPTIGPIMLASAMTTAFATTLAWAGSGLVTGGFVGALVGFGIPKKQAQLYHDRILNGNYLILVEGTDAEIRLANSILTNWKLQEWHIYQAPDLNVTDTDFPVNFVPEDSYPSPNIVNG